VASHKSFAVGVRRPVSLNSIPTSYVTPQRTTGWRWAVTREMPCDCSVGGLGRCSIGTVRVLPMSAPETRIGGSHQVTGCDD
jgi:hypothetical protein